MEKQGRIAIVLGLLWPLAVSVRADMTPTAALQLAALGQTAIVDTSTDPAQASSPSPWFCTGASTFELGTVHFLPATGEEVTPAVAMQPPPALSGGPTSLGLCLYTLFGLGLCRSAPSVRRLFFGFVPEWYHQGGPSQIGHSFALAPDCLCSAPVHCFIQPDCEPPKISPPRVAGAIASALKPARFTRDVLPTRGPPARS